MNTGIYLYGDFTPERRFRARYPGKGNILRRHPLSLPRFLSGLWSYLCQPRLYHALFNYSNYIESCGFVKKK